MGDKENELTPAMLNILNAIVKFFPRLSRHERYWLIERLMDTHTNLIKNGD